MIYSLCVVSSFIFHRKNFYLKYRDILIKYTTNPKIRWGDTVVFETPRNLSEQKGFYQVMDYFAALMYHQARETASIRLYYPIQSPLQRSITIDTHSGIIYPATVQKNIGIINPELVTQTDTELQRQLLRLWLTANSTEDIYYQNLFYWQILVFPNKQDKTAREFIDANINSLNEKGYINEVWVKFKNIMATMGKEDSLGSFMQHKIKNTISHFVRENGYILDVANLDTMRLFALSRILLRHFCLLKLKENIPSNIADMNTCRQLTPGDVSLLEKAYFMRP